LPRRKLSDQPLTALELEIMEVLWKTGPAAIRTVRARPKDHQLAYTTVQTMLNVLHRKGKVTRQLQGRGYVYQPVFTRQQAVTKAVVQLLDRFFGGSAGDLVLNLVATGQVTALQLARIQRYQKHFRPETLARMKITDPWLEETRSG
jgi:BlaI family transcriptional regulator, penicillinase repressor